MRIKSNFHDYYDGVQSFGQDQELLYLRMSEKIILHKYYTHLRNILNHRYGIIGFCGRLYKYVQLKHKNQLTWHTCYKIEDIDKFFKEHTNKKENEKYTELQYTRRIRKRINQHTTRKSYQHMLELSDKDKPLTSYFEQYKCPVFIVGCENGNKVLTVNGQLKKYGFQRVVDPYTAYQEISMYFGNIAQPENTIPEVSDKDMITAKGFDKWSFRKEPTKKRKN